MKRSPDKFSWRRAGMHTPHGALIAWFATFSVATACLFSLFMVTYEVTEDWRISDEGYQDIVGVLIGMAALGIIIGLFGSSFLEFWR